MTGTLDRTRTVGGDGPRRAEARADHLFLILQADAPGAGSSRHSFAGVDEVVFGRGSTRRVQRSASRIEMKVADPWMSSRHAVLRRERAHWVIEDLGSKNGVVVDGESQTRAVVLDGAVIELGRTFFVLRTEVVEDPARPDCDGGSTGLPAGLVTLDPELARRFGELVRIAPSPASVLVHGPTGSGKELAARAVHAVSRRKGPFVAVNCGALPGNLVESELFGYRKGAFSGATEDREGLIAASRGGTLFLDEIGDLAAPAQAALLRVLEERRVRPIGATASVEVDLRVVSATHHDLERKVEDGGFREDLLARLAGFVVTLPSLRDRRVDLGLLIGTLLTRGKAREITFTGDALRALVRHDWPRNVRELAKCLERATALADGGAIEIDHLPPDVRDPPDEESELGEADAARRDQLVALLEQHGGNISEVSRALGKVRAQVQRWLKRYGIEAERYRR
jgi:DNA-binding NtrC family response regulator